MRARRQGFTLIELMISAALMSMIMVAAYVCLRSGVSSRKLIDRRAEVFQNARVAMAMMVADLRPACPLSKDYEFLGLHRMMGDVEADNLDFGTHNYTPRRLHEGDFCEMSYFLAKEPESGRLSLWRRRDTTPDPEPLEGGVREEIARGLAGLRFEYYDGLDWYDDWGDAEGREGVGSWAERPNLSGLPEAVRITLWFDPGRQTAMDLAASKEGGEQPLEFQTIVRLELAEVTDRSSSGGSSSATNNTTRAAQENPAGGAR